MVQVFLWQVSYLKSRQLNYISHSLCQVLKQKDEITIIARCFHDLR